MIITMMNADAENNVADAEDCADWADTYGITHPVLADDQGFTWETMEGGYNYPIVMLVDRGMVVKKVGVGAESVTDEEILSYL